MRMKEYTGMLMKKKFWSTLCTVAFALFVVLNVSGCTSGDDTEVLTDELVPIAQEEQAPSAEEGTTVIEEDNATVNVPEEEDTDAMISISVENMGRANPFLPPGEAAARVAAIPKETLQYDLLPPLEEPKADESASTVVTTRVSGIMYDKNSPSAILNVNGSDYLVRSGDVLNGYKVLSIGKSVVTVQMGANVYKAGVGELIAEGKDGIKYNQVANLSSKFGGSKK